MAGLGMTVLVLLWRLDRDRPVQVGVSVVHDVALGTHLGPADEAIGLADPESEPGRHVRPQERDDRRPHAVDRFGADETDCHRTHPEIAVIAGRPGKARGGERRLVPGTAPGPKELVLADEDLGRVVDSDLRAIRRLEPVPRHDRRAVRPPSQLLGQDRGLEALLAAQCSRERGRAVRRRKRYGRLDRNQATIGVDRQAESPVAGLLEGRGPSEASEAASLVERSLDRRRAGTRRESGIAEPVAGVDA
jgi:hypothetical protein